MLHILFLVFFILNKYNFNRIKHEMIEKILDKKYSSEDDENPIKPGKAETLFFEYHKSSNITFDIPENNSIQINMHAINCNFDLKFNGEMMKQLNLGTYSFIINSTYNIITITPLLDVIDGKYKENYAKKTCPLSINSYVLTNNLSEPELKIENKEKSYFYLDHNKYNLLKLSYKIKEVSKESYVGLFFQFNEKSNFSVDIYFENKNNSKNENISYSTIIFLNSSFLLYNKNKTDGGSKLWHLRFLMNVSCAELALLSAPWKQFLRVMANM